MRDPDRLFWFGLPPAVALVLLSGDCAFGYVGPGADLALVSYFFSLLAWVGVMCSALLLWPLHALIRYLRGGKRRQQESVAGGPVEQTADEEDTSARST